MKRSLGILVVILVASVSVCGGCSGEGERQVQDGDTVSVHYTGSLNDGTVFDSSEGRDPLPFTVGAGQVIPGFEKAVIGLKLGESVTVTIPVDEAYGPYREDLVVTVDRSELPADREPEIGQQLQRVLTDGSIITFVITEVAESTVTLDANHPLAGKELTFDIELVEIK